MVHGYVLRAIVCWTILLLHVATIIAAPFLIVNFEHAMQVILILMPLTGLYVGVVVNFYSRDGIADDQESFSLQFSALTIFLVFTFSVAVIGVQYLYYGGRVETLEQLKRAVGIIDTALGVYSGFMIKRLFRG
ncbi:hypothetical protein RPMA_07175 [Tardiphaga alba]|uniref:Uncharacterized protein n=1 Tax=Tardiphaga alba TaxID=340268 RepID=A0ABX8A4N7_9BRAD|nr:hypothetical protein [Tardiphaga alba]QUS38641.1 hypothetical protein RPMA_07175 [Tardiphaga alba]